MYFLKLATALLSYQPSHRAAPRNAISRFYSTATIEPDGLVGNDSKYEYLLEWLRECATVSEKVTLAESKCGGGYGAFVTEAVEPNELLFEIPRSLCMTVEDALADSELGEPMKLLIEKAGPGANTVALAGFISKERLKGDDSLYAPYLDTLPWERFVNSQEHVLYWSEEQVEGLLKESMGYDEVIGLKKEVDLAISVLGKVLVDGPPRSRVKLPWETDEPDPKPRAGLADAVVGSFVCLLTRAFQDGIEEDDDDEKLVPLLDMLQHSEEPNVRHTMNRETGAVQVRARSVLQPKDELLNQYRSEMEENMPKHRFFTRFGFVPGLKDETVVNLLVEKSPIFFAQKAEV